MQAYDEECIHGLTPNTCVICKAPARSVASTREPVRKAKKNRKTPENSPSYFNHPWPLWFQMRDAGAAHIISRAGQRRKTYYGELWTAIERQVGEELGNSWRQLPYLLGDIAKHVYDEIGLILTALVIYEEGDEHPGEGFFRLAAEMGALREEDAPPVGERWEGMTTAQRDFWETQVQSLFARFAGT